MIFKNQFQSILVFIKKNQLEFLLVVGILILAAFFRFYKIDQYMTFLGDEGRDAIVIKKILVDHDFPLLGPVTSVGNMYLGPLYYYMMSVPMAVFWLNPVAAAGMVAFVGLLTIILLYYLTREWFGRAPALVAAFLYSVSPVTITYSKSSWNPNPAPFFTLLAVLGLYQAHKSRNFRWFILTGAALGGVVQMHYLAVILIPIFGLLWLWELFLNYRKNYQLRNFISSTILAIVVFFALISPLFIFDFKYNFMNFRSMSEFFTKRETTVNLNLLNAGERVLPIYSDSLLGRYLNIENTFLAPIISILVIVPLLILSVLFFKKRKINYWPFLVLATWLVIGIFGLVMYKRTIYDHYIGFLSPVPFILLGAVSFFIKERKLQLIAACIMIVVLGWVNLKDNPISKPPQNQLKRTQEISKFVIVQTEGRPFNFALLAKSNYDAAYQFYLDQYGHKPKQVPFEITDQLWVVCEDPDCQPVTSSKQEISHFGWSKIEKQLEFEGIKIYKLVHNPEGKSR